jgi:ribulose-phosphate 3-epimerase
MHRAKIVAPSLLSADFGCLAADAQRMLDYGAQWLHVDVMDGHFVPNLTIGAPVVAALRKHLPTAFLDCHLMVTHPEVWVADYVAAGASMITFHIEAVSSRPLEPSIASSIQHSSGDSVRDLIDFIRVKSGGACKVGIAVKPKTGAEAVMPYLSMLDYVLVMTVEPGFGGQSFMADMMPKLETLHQARGELPVMLGTDGGIDARTAPIVASHGCDVVVAGSAIFKAADPKGMIATLQQSLSSSHAS